MLGIQERANAQIPGDVDGFFVCFPVVVLVLLSGCLSCVFCLWGWYFVWSFSPSRLGPFLVSCLLSSLSLSLSLSLCIYFLLGMFEVDVVSFLSHALGNPSPQWFGFPLVTLLPGRVRSTAVLRGGFHFLQIVLRLGLASLVAWVVGIRFLLWWLFRVEWFTLVLCYEGEMLSVFFRFFVFGSASFLRFLPFSFS